MKRLILTIVLFFSISIFVSATHAVIFFVEDKVVSNDSFEIKFLFDKTVEINSYQMKVFYDNTILTPKSVKKTLGDGQLLYNINSDEGFISIAYASVKAEEFADTIFKIDFDLKEESNWTSTMIRVKESLFFDKDGGEISISVLDGKLSNGNYIDEISETSEQSDKTESENSDGVSEISKENKFEITNFIILPVILFIVIFAYAFIARKRG